MAGRTLPIRGRNLACLILCLAIGSLPCAVHAEAREGVPVEVMGDWSPGFQKDEPTASILELVRGREKIENWTELVTVQRFALDAWGGRDPQDVYAGSQQVLEAACPGMVTWNEISRDEHRVVYEWTVGQGCAGQSPQWEIAAVLVGRTDRYRVAYSAKKPVAPTVREAWIRLLECLRIMDVKTGEPVWGRPTAPPWVQRILDSKSWAVGGYVLSGLPVADGSVMRSCMGKIDGDIVNLVVEAADGTLLQFQQLERVASDETLPLQKIRAREMADHKRACGRNWTTRAHVEEPRRIVYEDVFAGCKSVADKFEASVWLLTDTEMFLWTTIVRDGGMAPESRSALMESLQGIRVEQVAAPR